MYSLYSNNVKYETSSTKKTNFLAVYLSFTLGMLLIMSHAALITENLLLIFQAANCAYVIIIMAIYWMTEALPMAVTALLPIALMPWLDVSSSKRLCANYLKVLVSLASVMSLIY
jgi:sodium-dependent dicarboxylate transporter 2/3/5